MITTIEKTIKDNRGTIRIEAKIYAENYNKYSKFSVRVWHKAPRKRNESINNNIATEAEKMDVLLELWQQIKPTEIFTH